MNAVLALLAFAGAAAPVPKAAPDKLDEAVAPARNKAIDFLKSQRNEQGNWEALDDANAKIIADMDGGRTALAALALLRAGIPANDAALVKAIDYLAKLPPKKTYVVSLQTQVLVRADAKKYKDVIRKNADRLLDNAIGFKGGQLEGWSYGGNPGPWNRADGSNTHFAVMALHTAVQAGIKVDDKIWPGIRDLYIRTRRDAGWMYLFDRVQAGRATESMTASALLGLAIAGSHIRPTDADKEAFEKGMEALAKANYGVTSSQAYLDLTLAELGQVLGSREFNAGAKKVAWYREGVARLLKDQKADGSWKGKTPLEIDPVLCTAMELYFLGPPPK
ncbi:MAG TPA: hypothetical protein VN641_01980 [Urbifossiella sp.]|jgi:hypothetical protein|nr:hypothetical protein [Urbifossiella sp.]